MLLYDYTLVFCNTALPLRAEDVDELFSIRQEHCRVWRVIGTKLGINIDTLNAIEKDHTTDKDRLHAVIDSVTPTHEAMAKVLQTVADITSAVAGIYNHSSYLVSFMH